MQMIELNLKGLEFSLKIKDILKFENLYDININVFEISETVLLTIYKNTDYDQPQIDLMLCENHCCQITKLRCFIKKIHT